RWRARSRRRGGWPPSAAPRRARGRAPRAVRGPRARRAARMRGRCSCGLGPYEVVDAVAAARQVALDQGDETGHALLWRRAIGDVLAREGVLVHLGAHVAGVDRVDVKVGVLGAEHGADLLERGLGGAVAAP